MRTDPAMLFEVISAGPLCSKKLAHQNQYIFVFNVDSALKSSSTKYNYYFNADREVSIRLCIDGVNICFGDKKLIV